MAVWHRLSSLYPLPFFHLCCCRQPPWHNIWTDDHPTPLAGSQPVKQDASVHCRPRAWKVWKNFLNFSLAVSYFTLMVSMGDCSYASSPLSMYFYVEVLKVCLASFGSEVEWRWRLEEMVTGWFSWLGLACHGPVSWRVESYFLILREAGQIEVLSRVGPGKDVFCGLHMTDFLLFLHHMHMRRWGLGDRRLSS